MKKIIIAMIASLVLIFALPIITQASPLAYVTERIAGQDQIETALKISQKGWDSAQTVILCQASDYPDSIAATPYAVNLNAPILLTGGDALDPRVVQELQRLKPQKIILLGGTACLTPAIEKGLEQLSFNWERIGGIDRYETSVLLAKRLTSDSLIIVNGDNFPDALSAATYAGIKQIPVVLTSTTLPDSVLKYLKENAPKHITVIGGEAVVPSVELTKNNFTIETRLGGEDRYDTNAKVVSSMKDIYQSNDLFLASGITFPDAVAGTVLASKEKAPLLLTEQNDIPPSVYSVMRLHMVVEPPASTSSTSASGNTSKTAVVTAANGLNLRDTPSSSGNLLGTIPNGAALELGTYQNHWYQTTYQSKTGWVSDAYITISSNSSSSTSNSTKKGIVNASAGLNLRDTPSSTGKLLATIPQDTTLELLNYQNDWYQTTYQSLTGWVSDSYVTLSTSNSASAIDLSPNGKVFILGGTGIISTTSQAIIEGKASSNYSSNLKAFPQLPSSTQPPSSDNSSSGSSSSGNSSSGSSSSGNSSSGNSSSGSSSSGNSSSGNSSSGSSSSTPTNYDPSQEILVDPFAGIPANALSGKTIMIDPGHGSPDTGAVGPNGTYEKDNTLAIAKDLNSVLQQAGAKVLLTRDNDPSPAASDFSEINDLQDRVDDAAKNNPDLFISIHNDSFSNPSVQGTTTYYCDGNPQEEKSKQLASSIQSAMIDTVKTNNRGVKDANFYVIKYTTMPAVLVETAFISSPYEEARLQNDTFRKNVAAAIFHGIYNYYNGSTAKN
ncbi:N-acetylmuramoyl-L-alanine amidase LytC precursor [Desulfosporosinus acididurans]|uniref:N-acetylmuramoyl-L-alanine amidase LytC n=1 Tax=Desulfosporosinus acididurans TaxID=476652 RepID=A0A0J1FQL7_9FIRM|nr:N-acetylmuramoyl-L-alanine amidase [Desulfosporosinus acididurans]KLU65577.1 N-acetylmuramoyl-L-alanine amidase LytC precursor [Desulfosporosinus acididurans]